MLSEKVEGCNGIAAGPCDAPRQKGVPPIDNKALGISGPSEAARTLTGDDDLAAQAEGGLSAGMRGIRFAAHLPQKGQKLLGRDQREIRRLDGDGAAVGRPAIWFCCIRVDAEGENLSPSPQNFQQAGRLVGANRGWRAIKADPSVQPPEPHQGGLTEMCDRDLLQLGRERRSSASQSTANNHPMTSLPCRANGVDFIFGVAPTSTLRRHIERLEASTMARSVAAPHAGKVRRYTEFYDGAASWSRVERIIARVEAGADGTDTRFIVTSLPTRNARVLYEEVYCRRGEAENHIKAWKTHLAADRTSCTKATANQFRLFLHAGAYWLMWSLRALMPKRSPWRVAQFDTLRLRLIKIAARVVELKTQIRLHLPTACPNQAILRAVLGRIPRLVT